MDVTGGVLFHILLSEQMIVLEIKAIYKHVYRTLLQKTHKYARFIWSVIIT